MFGFGLQIFALLAIALTILLAAYALYVRIRSNTYTERRFSFVALWSCVTIISAAFFSISDVQLLSIAAGLAGIKIEITTLPEKALIVLLAVAYCAIVRGWALSWNGLLTEQGKKNHDRKRPQPFIEGGLAETVRILKRQPPLELSARVQRSTAQLTLSTPLDQLPLHEQIRLLLELKWPEYDISVSSWIGETSCWLGNDSAHDRALMVVCAENADSIRLDSLLNLNKGETHSARPRVLFVLRFVEADFKIYAIDLLKEFEVEILSLDQLVEKVANFEEYRLRIHDEFKRKHLPDASFAIADVLAPTRVRVGLAPVTLGIEDIEEDDDAKEVEQPVDFADFVIEWLRDETSSKQLALLGKYGQGKSTAALALTHTLLSSPDLRRECGNRIPILIRLTGRSPSTTRLEELLGAWGAQYNLSGQVLLTLHRAGRLFLIFDAFDEMAHVMDRTARFEHFDALWEFASASSKILFTGRPNFFLDDEELKEILGISRRVATGPYCEAIRVAPFNMEQIEKAIIWLHQDKRSALVEAVNNSSALKKICCRPSLLYLIAHLWVRGRLDLQNANVNSAEIVREFIGYSLERQVQKQKDDASHRSERHFLSLTKSELDYFTSGIAVASLIEGRQNSVPKDVFESRIRELYDRVPQSSLKPGRDEVRTLAAPMRNRFADLQNPVEVCIHAVRTHGVIEHDVARPRHYRFSHKSFCEVLAAEVLKNSILVDDDLSAAIEQANFTSLVELANQKQIVEFVAEFLGGGSAKIGELSYLDLYKRVFPSRLNSNVLVRARSILNALAVLLRNVKAYNFVATGIAALVLTLGFALMAVTIYLGDQSAGGLRYVTLILIWGFNLLAPPTYYLSVVGGRAENISKLNLISRLCDLLERDGRVMYRSRLERRAHKLAATVLDASIRPKVAR